ncbi:MAG TPA: FHA domain-containing protein [Anaerolineae bacterium]
MSTEGEAHYLNNQKLLTLKGQVTVHFIDGNTLEGEITNQDAYNIFLTVDDQPHMIPRLQIRYILGTSGQPVERDTASEAALRDQLRPGGSMGATAPSMDDLVMSARTKAGQSDDQVEFDFDDDDGGTFVLDPGADGYPADLSDISAPDEAEDTDMTFVLNDTADLPGGIEQMFETEPDADDATVVIDDTMPEITAHLVCTAGPHAGESLALGVDMITVGRASDNEFPLSNDKEISRRHAVVRYEMGKFLIQDQNSLNGTFVNDERIDSPHFLEDGDVILIGVSHLEFRET